MASKKNYYELLGIGRETSQEEIRWAYRKLARRYHPDVNKDPNAPEKFREIHEAYKVLSDPKARKDYDSHNAVSSDQVRIRVCGPSFPDLPIPGLEKKHLEAALVFVQGLGTLGNLPMRVSQVDLEGLPVDLVISRTAEREVSVQVVAPGMVSWRDFLGFGSGW